MAGQLLTSLKTSEAKPAASHEARLSIMVITILVFAFGFLVYHKMDVHQRQLTQAAIAPTATAQLEVPQINPAALISQNPQAAASDPLVNIGDLSDGSPFSNTEVVLVDAASENRSTTESFETLTEPVTTQPVISQPAEDSATPEFAFNEPPQPQSVESQPPVMLDFPPLDASRTESAALAETQETPAALETSSADPDSTPANADIEETLVMTEKETPLSQPGAVDFSFDPADEEPSFSAPEPVEEPVLLAMAEPQQTDEFANGFLQDDSTSTSNSPAEQRIVSPQQKTQSDSRGFNAVKNPGGRTADNPIRTAAGSGSDGKFSLAAFNYQNGVVESAPDDGSTFDSVVVQNGDNYTKISKRVYGTVRYFSALAVFNQHRISEPKNMRPGMVVLVPAKEVLEERYPEFFVDSQPKIQEPAGFLLLDDGTPAYRVGERETISEISGRFLGRSSRWIEIYRLNQSVLKDPNKLKAGLILALPADAAEVNVVP